MLRPARIFRLAALCLVLGRFAFAQVGSSAASAPTAPSSTAPAAACPDTFALEEHLRGLLQASACGVPERQLLLTLRQTESVLGTLVVLKDYQAEFVREVRGSSCAEVEGALTLALEIFLDPGEAGDAACIAKDASGELATAPTDWPGQDLDPFNLPESEPAPLVPVIEPQPRTSVRGVLQIDTSLSPNVAFGVGALARLRLTVQTFLELGVSQQVTPPFVAAERSVHVAATSLLAAFGQHLPIGTRGEFSLQAGPRVSFLEVGSSGFGAWEISGTVAVQMGATLGLRLAPGSWGGVYGGASLNVLRARFLDGSGGVAWEQPWTGAVVGLYFSAAVPALMAAPVPTRAGS